MSPTQKPAPQFTVDDLNRRARERNAVNALIWGLPAVNYDLMYQAGIANKAGPNTIVYWSRLSDWKNQTLTPNPGAIYLMPFISVKDGPVVMEVPPASDEGSITGNLDDAWQVALEDVGPSGADKGKGGKYLILPPGYKDKVPEGYLAMPSDTYQNFALLRSILTDGSEAGIAKAVAYGKCVKLYPLSLAANPPATRFIDVVDVVFEATIPYDLRYFESLNRMVQSEPWLERDRAMIDPLKSLGIEKGRPFSPDAETQQALKSAALEAHAWLDQRYQEFYSPAFFEGTRWALPVEQAVIAGQSDDYAKAEEYPYFNRGVTYSMGFIGVKHLGAGQYYLMAMKDSRGEALDGKQTYCLTVPPNVPVKQYWSVTLYDRETHAFIRNMSRAGRSSQEPTLGKNRDGSVDIYFGPKAAAGKETNWIPTDPARPFEVLMRFYGPEKSLFDKTWRLQDVRPVN